ncbi:glutathione peroxidase [Candidatus Saccharibacteria bacterium]|nr:glutathione peroxidase [Candidatus Saccharibacteria bacterium]MBR6122207.1 glutathione peroxidase [Candidatus Saccharibacteria bacterium]
MSIYDYKVKTREDKDFALETLKGKVLLIVNTATGCGFTPQYEGLETLYKKYHAKGLEVLDFPCDQFGHQAPGSDDEIHNFCVLRYETKFDQFKKLEVNGDKADPLFTFLKTAIPEDPKPKGVKNQLAMKSIAKLNKATASETGFILWNFTKFLVDRTGKVVYRFGPTDKPLDFEDKIKELL